jgi:hypothetical protein
VSDHDESDPFGETRSAEDPLGPFEAFKAARAKEPAAPEPFPEPFAGPVPGPGEAEPTAVIFPEPGAYGPIPDGYTVSNQYAASNQYPASDQYAASNQYAASDQYAASNEYTAAYPPLPPDYGYAGPGTTGDPGQGHGPGAGRGRSRSVLLFGAVVVLAVGLGGGVYAATQSSSGTPAASPGTTAGASASPSASKAAKGAKTETVRLTVTAVTGESFTGTTAAGATVTAQIVAGTKFGTAARPFTRSQLVAGAVVFARLRRDADGTVVATVIAAGTPDKASGAASASPSAGA